MSRKGKKRRSSNRHSPTAAETGGRSVTAPRSGEGTAGGLPAPSPFPPLGASLARGLRVVGSSPTILATAFLSLLAAWATFVVVGAESTARLLAVAMAIWPANLFTDLPVAFGSLEIGRVLASLVALAVVRSLTFTLLISLIGQGMRGRVDLGTALRRLPRNALTLTAIYLAGAGGMFVVLQLAAGFLGQLSLLVVAAAIYLLAFVPVVAVIDQEPMQAAFRRGLRVPRLPGTRHLPLVLLYFLAWYFLLVYSSTLGSPLGPLAPATPDPVAWALGLAVTFLHVGVLGALVVRWLAVRDQVPARPEPPPAGRS